HVVIPAPPRPARPVHEGRFRNDLLLTAAYLRKALQDRGRGRPTAVALVLSKLDALFPAASEAEAAARQQAARAQLTDERLLGLMAPLVTLLRNAGNVTYAAIFPTSAYGFGTNVPEGVVGNGDRVSFPAEPTYVLRPDAVTQPFNVGPLVLWDVLAGL